MDFRAGDILAFSGRGLTSWLIELVTYSRYSHVGIVAAFPGRGPMLVESTTLDDQPCEITGKKFHGVQAHTPATRIASYPGHVYRLPLRFPLTSLESALLTAHLVGHLGQSYDYVQAMLSATHRLKNARPEDFRKFYCAELVADAVRSMRVDYREWLPNCSNVTPSQLIEFVVGKRLYYEPEQVK